MSSHRAIIALSDLEIADFLPGPMWGELERLLPGYQRVPLPLNGPKDWERLWRTSPADILISAWQTPSLNSTLQPADLKPLRYICHLTGSVRKLVPRELIEQGVVVTNWGGSISATVAECTLMLILMALRRASHWAVAMHRDGAWKDGNTFTQSLLGRRVGIHGFGSISQCLVPMLRPFTSRIQAYSPSMPDGIFSSLGVNRLATLEELFAESDVVVELAAATPENH